MDRRFGTSLVLVLLSLAGCSLRELDDFRASGAAAPSGGAGGVGGAGAAGGSGATGPGGSGAGGGACGQVDLCSPPIEVYEDQDPEGTTAIEDFAGLYDPAHVTELELDECRMAWTTTEDSKTLTMIACRVKVPTTLYVEADGQRYRIAVSDENAVAAICPKGGGETGCPGTAETHLIDVTHAPGTGNLAHVAIRTFTEETIATGFAFERGTYEFPEGFSPSNLDGMAVLSQVDGPAPACKCDSDSGETVPQ